MAQSDEILIVDIESTCWKNNPPPGQQSEIIEIGVCLLDPTTGEIRGKRSMLVKPSRSKVSPFCTELTTITPEMVADGIPFTDACAILTEEYKSAERLWGSWGHYDRRMFSEQCQSFGIAYPFGEGHLNIKQRFSERLQISRRLGMAAALEIAGLRLEGTHHRGHDDAYNIARLLWFMLQKYGQDVLRTS